jgi:hypothetical protein
MSDETKKDSEFVRRMRAFIDADVPTKEEFLQLANALVQYVERVDTRLSGAFTMLSQTITEIGNSVKDESNMTGAELKKTVRSAVDAAMQKLEKRLSEIKDGEPGKPGDPGESVDPEEVAKRVREMIFVPTVEDVADQFPHLGERVRDALELLQGEERLDASAIKGLDRFISKQAPRVISGAMAGNVVRLYDLSDKLNGADKTFALPAFWRIVGVAISSFPGSALQPLTDYTADANASTITFGDSIDATTQLSAGQVLLVQYTSPV